MLLLHWKQAFSVRTNIQLADWTSSKSKHSYLRADYLDKDKQHRKHTQTWEGAAWIGLAGL